jgi:hypothetical protein
MLRLLALAFALAGWLASPSQALPTLVITPVSDGSVVGSTVISDNTLPVGAGFHSVVKFARTSIPSGVSQAQLILTPWSGVSPGGSMTISGYAAAAAPIVPLEIFLPSTPIGTFPLSSSATEFVFDVTSFVLGPSAPYLSFRLESPFTPYQFSSLEINLVDRPAPRLLLTVPEPTVAPLLAAGLLGIAAQRRARSRSR